MSPCIRGTAWMGLLSLVVGAAVFPVACGPPKSVGFSLDVPVAAKWLELGAFRGGSCASLGPQLGGGVPNGYSARVAFDPSDPNHPAPEFGSLPRDSYAFVGTARDENCKVVAIGCVESEVDDDVTLGMFGIDDGAGGCTTPGTRCDLAQCLPIPGGGSLGENCSLDFVGSGPFQVLNAEISGPATGASTPAVTPTRDGFVVAYAEVMHDTGYTHVRVLHVGANGSLLSAGQEVALEVSYPRCPSKDGDTSALVAQLALEGSSHGLLALPHGAGECNPTGGVDFFTLKNEAAEGETGKFTLSDPKLMSAVGADVRFANGGHLVSLGGGKFLATSIDATTSQANIATATFDGTAFAPGTVAKLLAPASRSLAAASDKVLAIATVGRGAPGATPVVDAGTKADAGQKPDAGAKVDAGSSAEPDAGSSDSDVLRVAVGDLNGDPTTFDYQPVPVLGLTWSSIAANGERAAIVYGDADGPHYAIVTKGEIPSPQALPTNSGNDVPIVSAAAALRGDRLFVATFYPSKAESGVFDASVSLVSIDLSNGASAAPHEVVFGRLQSVPSVARMRDGQLAIGFTDSRVIVSWTTARALTPQDGVGGYAMFACK